MILFIRGMNKAARENQALRMASEAVKLMAFSQGVNCKMDISKGLYENKCSGKTPDEIANMKGESAKLQWKRILAFFKYIKQGITPPACLKELPEIEEKAFVQELRDAIIVYENSRDAVSIQDWFLKHIFRSQISSSELDIIFKYFIRAGNTPGPLPPECILKGDDANASLGRFFTYVGLPDDKLQYKLEYFDYRENNTLIMADTHLTAKITDMPISFIDKQMVDNGIFNAFTMTPQIQRDGSTSMEPDLKNTNYRETIYIYTSFPVSTKIENTPVTFPGKYLGRKDIRVIDDIFTIGEVIDIHPWLLYLIQVNPVKFFFTKSLFGGKMAPPLKFKLAYYIVAHYVATHDPAFMANSSIFYKLPDSEKIPKMIAALKKNKCLQDDLLTAGYQWLNKESVKEVRPSMKELIDSQIGTSVSGLFNRTAKGGKRRTRKVRFTNL